MSDPAASPGELSFGDWAEARLSALLRFAHLVTGSQQAAEDAVQSALATAYEKWPRVQAAGDPDAYLRRMIVNADVSAWRRFGRRVTPVAEVRGSADSPDPALAVARADTVWRVCLGLPAQQRAAVVLRYYEDLEYAEIARILDCAEATARSHVHHALASLRRELEHEEDHDG